MAETSVMQKIRRIFISLNALDHTGAYIVVLMAVSTVLFCTFYVCYDAGY